MATKSQIVKVAGARLYYELYGSGPVLLMIPGGPTDTGIFAAVAGVLADRYTVVPYDPRGNSRSTLDGTAEDQRMDHHGDDAAAPLAALGSEPAYVFGSSGGAQIGLNLAARHPERVRILIAHEPPCLELLSDAAEQRALTDSVLDTYRKEGMGPAMIKFQQGAGLEGPQAAPPPATKEMTEAMDRITGNMDFFLAHGLQALSSYFPDIAALRKGSVRVVVGIGETSKGQLGASQRGSPRRASRHRRRILPRWPRRLRRKSCRLRRQVVSSAPRRIAEHRHKKSWGLQIQNPIVRRFRHVLEGFWRRRARCAMKIDRQQVVPSANLKRWYIRVRLRP